MRPVRYTQNYHSMMLLPKVSRYTTYYNINAIRAVFVETTGPKYTYTDYLNYIQTTINKDVSTIVLGIPGSPTPATSNDLRHSNPLAHFRTQFSAIKPTSSAGSTCPSGPRTFPEKVSLRKFQERDFRQQQQQQLRTKARAGYDLYA